MNKRIYIIVLFFSAFVCSHKSQAQLSYESISICPKIHYGFIWAHTLKNAYLVQGHFPLVELSLFENTSGSKAWHLNYNKPQIGISLIYSDLADKQNFGYTIGAYPWINFNLIKHSKYKLLLKTGLGLGYINKTFDIDNNYKNVAISAHINALVCLQVENQIKLSTKLSAIFGISFFHESNGASKLPNTGINIPAISAGLAYCIKSNKQNNIQQMFKDSLPNRTRLILSSSLGFKQIAPLDYHNYPVFELCSSFEKPYNKRQAFTVGIDLLYDDSYRIKLPFSSDDTYFPYNAGLNIGHTFYLGNVDIVTQKGIYFASKYLTWKSYGRLGLRYYFTKNTSANFGLWFHDITADHLEWGIGYRLK